MKTCKCIKVNGLLNEQGHELVLSYLFDPKGGDIGTAVVIETQKWLGFTGKKRKKQTLIASFCPFCGKKYPERKGRG